MRLDLSHLLLWLLLLSLYGPDRFHHSGFKCGYLGYDFKLMNHSSNAQSIHINEEDIIFNMIVYFL